MIRWLRTRRLTRLQLVVLASASGFATAVIIISATGGTGLQSAVLAALQRQRVVVHTVDAAAATAGTGASSSSAGSADPASGSAGNLSDASSSAGGPSGVSSSTSSSPGSPSADVASTGTSDISTGASTNDPAASAATGTTSATTAAGTATTSTTATGTGTTGTTPTKTYNVKHVFLIALSTTGYQATFGRGSVARYLDGTLVPHGTLLSGYRTLGRAELPDYLAMVSGQAPNRDTRGDCSTYAEFPQSVTPNAAGLVHGAGCIYPNTVLTIGDQVTGSGDVWKAYIADMGSSTCVHPNSGAADDVQLPFAGPQYDTRHNPFIYFHSLVDLGDCSSDDESLAQLPADLRSPSRTPSYAFIAPGLCDDAAQSSCPGGQPGGLAAEDAFLRLWVPRILRSAAYRQDGALIIVFTSAGSPTGSSATGPVRTGALVLSRYAKARHTLAGKYNPYSLLRSIEDIFGFGPLGHAKGARSFASAALPEA